MFPKASLTGRVVRTNNTMRMAKSWGHGGGPVPAPHGRQSCASRRRPGTSPCICGTCFFQPPTIALAKGTAPFALLPAATGAFYGNHLDKAWLALGGGVVGNVDFIALATLSTAVVGASLAWYLPQAAASRRYDPMAEALNARTQCSGLAALDRFGNADLADQWLARPHPSLDNRTPRDAAAAIELFIRALGLLQRPRAVAAA
jgi:Protein of unknown function (DUF2384)